MKRITTPLGAATVLASAAALIPGVASAAPTEFIFPAGELCAFEVGITPYGEQTTHDTGKGDILFTGRLTATVTNKETGATKSYNISGPTFGSPDEVPTAVTGPNLILQPASRNVGPAFLIYTTGRVNFTPDFTIASRTGRVTDVCAALSRRAPGWAVLGLGTSEVEPASLDVPDNRNGADGCNRFACSESAYRARGR